MKWISVELHCHTVHSDGSFTPEELVRNAKKHGLDAIAISDHNTTSSYPFVREEGEKQGLLVIPAIEWTTYYGHMAIYGICDYYQWYEWNQENFHIPLEEIRKNGGYPVVTHPCRAGNPMGTGCCWEYELKTWKDMGGLEVFTNENPHSTYLNMRAFELWLSLLDKGYRLTGNSGIDWHKPLKEKTMYSSTWLALEENQPLTWENLLFALKNHRTAVSVGDRFWIEGSQKGKKIPLGESLSQGEVLLSLHVESEKNRNHWEGLSVISKEIRILTNESEVVYKGKSAPLTEISLDLKDGQYLVGQLWGEVNGESYLLGFSSPLFVGEV